MKSQLAPREIFEKILEYSVIPTFDLVIEYGDKGVVFVKRKIAPYKNQWALLGLRMLKGETIEDTIKRIAEQELGLKIDASKKVFLDQYVGKFKTEHNRQDLSTGYYVKVSNNQKIRINKEHFSDYRITRTIPRNIGAMYKFYLKRYNDLGDNGNH